MTHLYVPPSVRRFAPRRVLPGPATRHMPLEYDLIEALRPELVVDLGAGDCLSYFTYCQSMLEHDVDGICYAIDAWSDESGVHPEATFEAINAHARKFYPGLTYLVRMQAHEARRHFDEETIDLLRLDGNRADVIAGADVEAWYRRVRSGGVIVWHGAVAHPQLWSLIASRGPSVTFREGRGGLGLVLKPGRPPRGLLLQLLFAEDSGSDLERFYAHVHEHHSLKRLLAAAQG